MKLLKFNLKSHDPSIYNCVIDYQRAVINYQWGNFKNCSEKSYLLEVFEKPPMAYTYVTCLRKSLEFFRTLLSYSLKNKSLVKHLQINKGFFKDLQLVSFFSEREKNLCTSKRKLLWSRGCVSHGLWVSWTRGRGIPRWFISRKRVLQV